MTPRVPNSTEVGRVMTPRVPSSHGGDATARRFAAEANGGKPASPSITHSQLSPLKASELSYLAKKLVHLSVMLEQARRIYVYMCGGAYAHVVYLSVMLEQDTVGDDTRYPTFNEYRRS